MQSNDERVRVETEKSDEHAPPKQVQKDVAQQRPATEDPFTEEDLQVIT